MDETTTTAIKTPLNKKLEESQQNKGRLVVETLTDLQALRLPAECARDSKKLTRFLTDVEKTVNKLIRGVQR